MHARNQTAPDLSPIDCPARPSVVVTRGGIVESEHFVRFAVADADGAIVESAGDIDAPTFLRSSAKPLICAVVVGSGAADRFGFTDAEIALAAGSHSGEPFHIEAARSMLAKIGLDEDALACGAHPPVHEPSAEALVRAGVLPSRIHNNCSGKHAGILALAVHLGAPPKGYRSPDHPAQRAILAGCAEMFDVPESSMVIGVDGCGIPVVAVPLRVSARFFARFSAPRHLPARWREPVERVRRAMVNNPQYVAGTGRFDTDLMRAAYPHVVCKGGAEGFHASSSSDRGIGMCVKVADGSYRAVSPFVIERLAALGALSSEESSLMERHRRPSVRNHAGEIVGEIAAI
jgi:L-asparaginase II